MREGICEVGPQSVEFDTPRLDFSGGETPEGLLSRLRIQNSALERLRRALDADEDECGLMNLSMVAERA